MRIAVVLFNLGGPDSPEAVERFLENLFFDPAILPLPAILRRPVAKLIAKRRGPTAQDIYAKIGGRSPILEETEAQAQALESELKMRGYESRAFIAMRAWKPFSADATRALKQWNPERTVLLPLYPQYSTTTTASSIDDWKRSAKRIGGTGRETRICCYPWSEGFITAIVSLIRDTFGRRRPDVDYRLLLSAHGLPTRLIRRGDPYRWQVEKTAEAIVDRLGRNDLDWALCFQSRVGPLEWIGPATDAEIRRAGAEHKGVIVAPIAFVSEHSETLVELDIEYARLAERAGVAHYLRVSAVGTHPAFVSGLADMIERAIEQEEPVTCARGRICPAELSQCGYGG